MRRPIRLRVNSLEGRITPGAGQLDPSFGTGGLVTTRFPASSYEYGQSSAVDSLGGTFVAGYVYTGSNYDFAVARYTTAGILDTSFASGTVVVGVGASDDYCYSVAVDSADRVLVAGKTFNGSNYDFAVVRLTSSGALDSTFDGDGKQTITFGAADGSAYGIAVDSADRVLVAGKTFNGSNYDFAVARLTSTGSLDSTFDGDGKQTITFGAADDSAYGIAVDSADRPLVAGETFNGSNYDFAVARLTSSGALDSTFDGDGKQTIAFGKSTDVAYGITVDSAGRALVAGSTLNESNVDFAVARLTSAGALDKTFGAQGKQTIAFGASDDFGIDVEVDSTDRVLVAGYANNGPNDDFAIARLTKAGVLDSTFDGDGKQTITFGASNDGAYGVVVDSADRVLAAGATYNGSNFDFAIVRLTTVGALDPSFDGDGKQTTGFKALSDAACPSVGIDSLGRIVVAGRSFNGSDNDFAVARYTPNGALDTSFGGTGTIVFAFGTSNDVGHRVVVDSADRVVVAGSSYNGLAYVFAVARLTSAGTLDPTFDGDGKQTIAFGTSADYCRAVAIDSADRVLVAGYTLGSDYDFAIARLTNNGALDSSFDGDGKQTIAFGPSNDSGLAVAVDSADRVVVAGGTNNGSNLDFAVARLTSAGELDATFDGDGKRTIAFGASDDSGESVVIDSTGRILIGGATVTGSNLDFAVARLTNSGVLDSTFDGDGKQTISFGTPEDYGYGIAVDSADRALIAGYTNNGSKHSFAVARLTGGGTLDSTFDGDGKQTISVGALQDSSAYGVAVDAAGRTIVAGVASIEGNVFAVARLTGDDLPAAKISAITVNGGGTAGPQRSMVTTLRIGFDTHVSFVGGDANAAAAFMLTNQKTGLSPTIGLASAVDNSGLGTVVTLNWTGMSVDPGNSLSDGRYTLVVKAAQFTSAGFDGGGGVGTDFIEVGAPGFANNLFRVFGDADGDGTVNSTDFASFRVFFGTGLSIFDFNNDGQTSTDDFAEFRKRFGVMV